jgi:hypothetical protein
LGHPIPAELRELSWHEHLLGCGGCRELMEREEALEELLATLPAPRLSPELARRVLERLREVQEALGDLDALLALDREAEAPAGLAGRVLASLVSERGLVRGALSDDELLDALLDRDPAPAAPAGLAERVLAGLSPASSMPGPDDRLEVLLDRDSAPVVPTGLADRLLDALEDHRFPARRPLVLRLVTSHWIAAASLVAASLLIAIFALRRPGEERQEPDHLALSEPPPGMLEVFDVLAEDLLFEGDLLAGEAGLDVDLSLSLGSREEVLMEYEFPEPASEEAGG